MQAGVHAERDSGHERHDHGHEHQLQSRRHALHHQLQGRLAEREGAPEVALHEVRDVNEDLLPERLVEAQNPDHALELFLVGLGRHQHVDRIFR